MTEYNVTSLTDCFGIAYRNGKIRKYILQEIPLQKQDSFVQSANNHIAKRQYGLMQNSAHSTPLPIIIEQDKSTRKPFYKIKPDLMAYLYMELLCQEIKECYCIVPFNPHPILNFMHELMDDNQQLVILRLDIVQFTERISFDLLLKKLTTDGKLSHHSIELLKHIVSQYYTLSGSTIGIPRGVHSTTLLCDVFMKDLDQTIQQIPGVCRYGRAGDDIIIFAQKQQVGSARQLFDKLCIILGQIGLTFHEPDNCNFKTDLIEDKNNCLFFYMGYHIEKTNGSPTQWLIDDALVMRYMFHIKFSVDTFLKRITVAEKEKGLPSAFTQLLQNLRYVSSNCRKKIGGKYLKSGIRFNLPHINSLEQLVQMDNYRETQINRIRAEIIPDGYMGANVHFSKEETANFIVKRCLKFKILEGFVDCRLSNSCKKDLRVTDSH